jgi:hypothetical protein
MSMDSPNNLTSSSGWWMRAEYRDQVIDDYRGNPTIEALPPIRSSKELAAGLRHRPTYDEADRQLPAAERQHLTEKILSFVQPLSIHIELAHRVSRLLRNGLVARNPVVPRYRTDMEAGLDALARRVPRRGPRSTGMIVAGISGAGKTTGLAAALDLVPQVIEHTAYQGTPFLHTQVVHLTVECPPDSSTRALGLAFVQAMDDLLGERYEHRYLRAKSTAADMLGVMARLAAVHSLGILVIDEIQHLASAKSGGEKVMLNFFSGLVNVVGVPVILAGTPKAVGVLTQEFRHARRGTGQGDMIWERMLRDTDTGEAEWELFVRAMWRYQYTREVTPLTPKLSNALYDESQGITDVTVKLYMLAQLRAIQTGTERITVGLIRSVAKDSLRSISAVLKALKDGKSGRAFLATLDDILAGGLGHYRRGRHKGYGAPSCGRGASPDAPGRGSRL